MVKFSTYRLQNRRGRSRLPVAFWLALSTLVATALVPVAPFTHAAQVGGNASVRAAMRNGPSRPLIVGATASGEFAFAGQSGVSQPLPRWGAEMAYDQNSSYVLLFGGSNGDITQNGTVFGDTWTYESGSWTDISPSSCSNSTCPEARTYGAMASYNHAGQQYVVMFGGQYAGPSGVFLRDTWIFNGSWYNVTPKSLSASNSPPPLHYTSMVWDPEDGYAVLYGGCMSVGCNRTSEISNQTWAFKGLNGAHQARWENLTNSTHPPALFGSGLAYDSSSSYVLLFGGATVLANKAAYSAQTWSYNETKGWVDRTAPRLNGTNTPATRLFPMLAYYPILNYTVLFGGQENTYKMNSSNLNDTWAYSNGTWTNLTPSLSTLPPGRFGGTMVFENTEHALVLFGGLSTTVESSAVLGDTWWFSGSPGTWSNQTQASKPPPPPAPAPPYRFSGIDYVILGGVVVWVGIGLTILLGRRKRKSRVTFSTPVPQPDAVAETPPPPSTGSSPPA